MIAGMMGSKGYKVTNAEVRELYPRHRAAKLTYVIDFAGPRSSPHRQRIETVGKTGGAS